MKTSLSQRLQQSLHLTPELKQAIYLLQLSNDELAHEISEQLADNPLLSLAEESTATDADNELESNYQDSEEAYFRDTIELPSHPGQPLNLRDKLFDITDDSEQHLHQHILQQLNLLPLSDLDYYIALAIIDGIDDHGYLTIACDDIRAAIPPQDETITDAEIEAVLQQIQHLDPIGIGSRNLQEFLLVQLQGQANNNEAVHHAKTIILEHFDLLVKHDFKHLRQLEHLKQHELAAALDVIHHLKPRPNFDYTDIKQHYIRPDVYVMKSNGQWHVGIYDDLSQLVKLNQQYADVLANDHSKTCQALKEKLQQARWFIKSLQNRNDTLLKVASAIIHYQQDFIEQGETAMRPLTLQQIAEITDLHESTISRITNHKYIYTPRGLFVLKYFG